MGIVSPMSGILNPNFPSHFQIEFVWTTVSPITHRSNTLCFKNCSPNRYSLVVDLLAKFKTSSFSSWIFLFSSSYFFKSSSGLRLISGYTSSSFSQLCCFCSSFNPSPRSLTNEILVNFKSWYLNFKALIHSYPLSVNSI